MKAIQTYLYITHQEVGHISFKEKKNWSHWHDIRTWVIVNKKKTELYFEGRKKFN